MAKMLSMKDARRGCIFQDDERVETLERAEDTTLILQVMVFQKETFRCHIPCTEAKPYFRIQTKAGWCTNTSRSAMSVAIIVSASKLLTTSRGHLNGNAKGAKGVLERTASPLKPGFRPVMAAQALNCRCIFPLALSCGGLQEMSEREETPFKDLTLVFGRFSY
jgi:hypothetical protein